MMRSRFISVVSAVEAEPAHCAVLAGQFPREPHLGAGVISLPGDDATPLRKRRAASAEVFGGPSGGWRALRYANRIADEQGVPCVVVTFGEGILPDHLYRTKAPRPIRRRLLAAILAEREAIRGDERDTLRAPNPQSVIPSALVGWACPCGASGSAGRARCACDLRGAIRDGDTADVLAGEAAKRGRSRTTDEDFVTLFGVAEICEEIALEGDDGTASAVQREFARHERPPTLSARGGRGIEDDDAWREGALREQSRPTTEALHRLRVTTDAGLGRSQEAAE